MLGLNYRVLGESDKKKKKIKSSETASLYEYILPDLSSTYVQRISFFTVIIVRYICIDESTLSFKACLPHYSRHCADWLNARLFEADLKHTKG